MYVIRLYSGYFVGKKRSYYRPPAVLIETRMDVAKAKTFRTERGAKIYAALRLRGKPTRVVRKF